MPDELRFELDCTSSDLLMALTLSKCEPAADAHWELAPLIDLVAAASCEAHQGALQFTVEVVELPEVQRGRYLRISVHQGTRRYRAEYSTSGAPDTWRVCLEGELHAAATELVAWQEHTAQRSELAVDDSTRELSVHYALHPQYLAAALQAAGQMLDARPTRIEAVSLLERGAAPTELVLQRAVDRSLVATFLDATGQVVAQLRGLRAAFCLDELVELAQASLGRAVNAQDHLLEQGASSIALMRLANALFERTGLEVSLATLLKTASLTQLLEQLRAPGSSTSSSAQSARLHALVTDPEQAVHAGVAPLNALQRAIWLASCRPDAARSYVESCAFRLSGPLDVPALVRAWSAVVESHESCRSYIMQRGAELHQVSLPVSDAAMTWVESAAADGGAAWLAEQAAAALRPGEPWVRASLLRLGAQEHLLSLVGHHALCDGRSLRERILPALASSYATHDPSPNLRPVLQARHVAQLEREPEWAAELARTSVMWREQLSGAPEHVVFPHAHSHASTTDYAGASYRFTIPSALAERLQHVARRERRSLFTLTLAAFRAALYRWSQLQDAVIGVPIAQAWSPHFQTAAGCFVDFVPLRLAADGGSVLRSLLDTAQARLSWALEHQQTPFAHVLTQPSVEAYRHPEIALGFSYEVSRLELSLRDLAVEPLNTGARDVKLPLFLRIEAADDALSATLEYRTALFDHAQMAQFAASYLRLLEALDQQLDTPLRELPWLSAEDRARVLAHARGPVSHDAPVLSELIAEVAATTPDTPAVIDGTHVLRYGALDQLANALAATLLQQRAARVGLFLGTGLHFPIGVLGALRSGVCFVPIEPEQPRARICSLLSGAELSTVATIRAHADHPALAGCDLILLDELTPQTQPVAHTPSPDTLAYGIYTSGSTGLPKLALATHAGVANKIGAQRTAFALQHGARVLQFASPAFDAAFSEAVLALAAGGTLVTADLRARYDGAALFSLLQAQRVEVAMLTPSVVRGLPHEPLPALALLLLVGEPCPEALVRQWSGARRLFNLYGPAETTVWATSQACAPDQGAPAIGRPIANVHAYVLDPDLNLLPQGHVGELCIGGIAVGPGYGNAPELTAERFVSDPHAADGGRLYRTGDRARMLPDGRLMYLGRQDHQVKLRGRRVELGEVEAALRTHGGALEAVAVLQAADTPAARIVAYVTQPQGTVLSERVMREALHAQLPNHAVPSEIRTLTEWPRLASGKIDRRALAELGAATPQTTHVLSRTPLEHAVVQALAQVLHRPSDEIHLDSDFFALGGHSLTAVALADALEQTTQVALPLPELLASPTVRQLAQRIEAHQHGIQLAVPRPTQLLAHDCLLAPYAVPELAPRSPWHTVLLTGATGGLGLQLLAALLRTTSAHVVCLVRASSDAQARERLARALDALPELRAQDRVRVRAVRAHLERPLLGVDTTHYSWLSSEVDAILHAAAVVDFSAPYAQLRTVNVEGTRALIDLAFQQRRKEFHYVSSLSALFPSAERAPRSLEERPGPAPDALTMSYGQSKAVCERLLASAAELGLPVRIYRPSRVCASAAAPSGDILSRFLATCIRLGRFPDLAGADNLIPSDVAAGMIVDIARQPQLAARYFHIANPVATTLDTFQLALQAHGQRCERVPYAEWSRDLAGTDLSPMASLFQGADWLELGLPNVDLRNTERALPDLHTRCPRVDLAWIVTNLAALLDPVLAGRAA